mgnify:CR=1 FL=1
MNQGTAGLGLRTVLVIGHSRNYAWPVGRAGFSTRLKVRPIGAAGHKCDLLLGGPPAGPLADWLGRSEGTEY